jgi:hypothetical protein
LKRREKTIFNNYLLVVIFDGVAGFLSVDVTEGVAVVVGANIRARSFTDNPKNTIYLY